MTTGYYLLDHPNPAAPVRANGIRFWGYPTRNKKLDLLVIHTAENLPDWSGPDTSAESVARYGATTTRPASWHVTVDADSTVPMLPDSMTAFHAVGYNSRGWGMEIATQAAKWDRAPALWTALILDRAASEAARKAKAHRIPVRRLTKAQADNGMSGFVAHADLDPGRRTDPGQDFPWVRFLRLVAAKVAGHTTTTTINSEELDVDEKTLRRIVREEATAAAEDVYRLAWRGETEPGKVSGPHKANSFQVLRETVERIAGKLGA